MYSSIKFLHRALNLPFIENEFQVDTILQSIKRKLAKVPFQVLPITPKILLDLYKFIDIEKPADLALWCSYLVAFYCLFRKANVAPKSLATFDPHKELSRQKFIVLEDSALVFNNFSKNNQFMTRHSVLPLCKHDCKPLDPIFHLNNLFSTDIPSTHPAFSYIENGKIDRITYSKFTSKLKSLFSLAGYSSQL